ncbi:MAG TPA: hypothetical protein VF819_00010, partial [Nitrospira sp.]
KRWSFYFIALGITTAHFNAHRLERVDTQTTACRCPPLFYSRTGIRIGGRLPGQRQLLIKILTRLLVGSKKAMAT